VRAGIITGRYSKLTIYSINGYMNIPAVRDCGTGIAVSNSASKLYLTPVVNTAPDGKMYRCNLLNIQAWGLMTGLKGVPAR
jgi:hypothetical protein